MDDGGGLENRYTGDCIVGSNPTPSASYPIWGLQNPPKSGIPVPFIAVLYRQSALHDATMPERRSYRVCTLRQDRGHMDGKSTNPVALLCTPESGG